MKDKRLFVTSVQQKQQPKSNGGGGRWFWAPVALITMVAGALAFSSAAGETQTWDEGIHISAGYAYLTRGDYRWNQEHPPLAKLMCALPLTFLRLNLPLSGSAWKKLDETQMGIQFLYQNRISPDIILFAARAINMLLFLLFIAALAWWVRRRFGPAAALLTAALCAFDPNLIAHARYVTTDFPVTVFYFFAAALWIDYLRTARLRDLAFAALLFAVAMITKFSAVLLIPTFAFLYAIRWIHAPPEFPVRRAAVAVSILAGTTFLAVAIIYWPETIRWIKGSAQQHAFFTGLNKVISHNQEGHPSFLLGMRSDQGWWCYFPVVFGVKSTVAALAATILVAATALWWAIRNRAKLVFQWWALLVPPIIYFLISMTSAINIGMRHILPVYPFLYVAAAALLAEVLPARAARYAMLALAALQIGECASIAPDYLAFFNGLSGGPGNGPHYLVDSNIDWGQDVKKLARWLQAHGTRSAFIAYFGNAQLPLYGLETKSFPNPLDEHGWDALDGYAVAGVTPLNGVYVPLDSLARLRLRQPIAKIGWSMYVYDFRKRATP